MSFQFNPFTGKLDKTIVVDGTASVSAIPDGTESLPGIAFASDTNTGIYRPGVDQLAISTGGTGRLFVDASGNVGVGTQSIADLLTIGGTASPRFGIQSSSASGDGGIEFGDTGDDNIGFIVYDHTADALRFGVNASERLRITSDGKLGLGTSSPSYAMLHVSSAASGAAIKSEDTAGTGSFLRVLGDALSQNLINWKTGTALRFATSDDNYGSFAERMRIDSSGYLRLSASSPGIQFNGDTAAANALDDYEEGTFTPTLLSDGGVSITLDVTAEGYYRKIGSIVHMWGTIKTTTNLNSANYYQLGTAFTSTLASATHVGTASSSTNAGNANQKSVFSVTSRVSGGLYFVRVSPDYDFSNEDGFSFFISTPV